MKKLTCLLITILLLFGGCKSMNPADYTISTVPSLDYPIPDNMPDLGQPPAAEYATYDEYSSWIDETYTGINFIHYDDISFVGEYYSYAQDFGSVLKEASKYHTYQYFGIKDGSGFVRRIEIIPTLYERDIAKYSQMPDVENYYRVLPANEPDNPNRAYYYQYRVGNIVYGYRSYKEDTGSLISVSWAFGNRVIQVFSSGHEITKDSGFFYDLTNPETAQSAVNKFNFAILMAYIGNCLVIWAPVIIPVLCIVPAGTVYLIILRKRKKTATKASQGIETKTEE